MPTTTGTPDQAALRRISWFKKHGLDLQAMYPVKPEHTALQDAWTYDEFMKYAEMAKKDDMGFALGLGGFTNTDGIDQVGAMFRAYGAALIDKEGTIQVKSDAMSSSWNSRRMVKFYPADARRASTTPRTTGR